ncbi:chromosome partition protein Smc-like [Pectinophora gossypiella]|uniref:chromosome partition protein Smc-like n=1 Tax=Pectinophora gossypiella TaxID=13191 RepID=UPI00214ED7C0|nr:chromosome partition protein Smc-like [Pectinophora gossypiella]XP_049873723.1 chromosome partition protein Smc-like [Pectinophora gossypiella]
MVEQSIPVDILLKTFRTSTENGIYLVQVKDILQNKVEQLPSTIEKMISNKFEEYIKLHNSKNEYQCFIDKFENLCDRFEEKLAKKIKEEECYSEESSIEDKCDDITLIVEDKIKKYNDDYLKIIEQKFEQFSLKLENNYEMKYKQYELEQKEKHERNEQLLINKFEKLQEDLKSKFDMFEIKSKNDNIKIQYDLNKNQIEEKYEEMQIDLNSNFEKLRLRLEECNELKSKQSELNNKEQEKNKVKAIEDKVQSMQVHLEQILAEKFNKFSVKTEQHLEPFKNFHEYFKLQQGNKIDFNSVPQSMPQASRDTKSKIFDPAPLKSGLADRLERIETFLSMHISERCLRKCYVNWTYKHDLLLKHGYVDRIDVVSALTSYLKQKCERTALLDIQQQLASLKHIRIDKTNRFPVLKVLVNMDNDIVRKYVQNIHRVIANCSTDYKTIQKNVDTLIMVLSDRATYLQMDIHNFMSFEKKYNLTWNDY